MPILAATRSAGRSTRETGWPTPTSVRGRRMAANFIVRRHSSRDRSRDGAGELCELDIQIQRPTERTTGTLWAQRDVAFGLTSATNISHLLPTTGIAPATATVDTTVQQT
jgi:hypothetical protein